MGAVPAGDPGVLGELPRFVPVSWWNLVLISAKQGIFAYRDGDLSSVPVSGLPDALNPGAVPFPISSINRVLVSSERGLFEVAPDLTMRRLEASAQETGGASRIKTVFQMPASGLAIVVTTRAAFALGRTGGLEAIAGWGIGMRNLGPSIYLLHTNELLFAGDTSLYVVADRRLSGAKACDPKTAP